MMKNILIDLDGTLLNFNLAEKNAFSEAIKYYTGYNINDIEAKEFSKINDYYFVKYKDNEMTRDEFHYQRFVKIKEYLNLDYDANLVDKYYTGYDINDIEAKEFSKINDYYFVKYKDNEMTRDEFHYQRFVKIKEYLNLDFDANLVDKYYINALKYHAEIFDDVIDTLDYLYDKYNLYVVSNGMYDVQIKKLELAKLNKYFKNIYISERVGYKKPELGFFGYVYNDIKDLNKSNYVIIGDRLDSDILGGNNFGITTIYLNRDNISGDIKANYEIKSLYDLKKIL